MSKYMKAAVLNEFGLAPVFTEIKKIQVTSPDEVLLQVKAASIKNLDLLRASGTHYASYATLPAVVGIDAVGLLPDGTRVYASGLSGTVAEYALISATNYTPVPEGLDDATAAALPNAVMGAGLALLARGKFQAGQHVLIQGATGVTGRMAVQLAKYYGAKEITVTGRNSESLSKLQAFGATNCLSLHDTESDFTDKLKSIHAANPIDLVIDYLWGRPMELLLQVFKGGSTHGFSRPVRIVTVGDMAGANIALPSGALRSSAIEILGSGLGSISPEEMAHFHQSTLPEMFALAASNKLELSTHSAPLSEIEQVWDQAKIAGSRLVIQIS